MRFVETNLQGLIVVEVDSYSDERGSFVGLFDASEWEARAMCACVVQYSLSRNVHRLTLRGMHYQEAPYAETKLVRCSRGSIFDVAVDLRADSPTFRQWFGLELSEENGRMLHIPEGFAHGFLTLTDTSEIAYQMSEFYVPTQARGVRWNDPAFEIEWPASPLVISERDRSFADFDW